MTSQIRRHGAFGIPSQRIRGVSVRVLTIVMAAQQWGEEPDLIADEFGLGRESIHQVLVFYQERKEEIQQAITAEMKIADQ